MDDQEMLRNITRLEFQMGVVILLLKLTLHEVGIREMSNEELLETMTEYLEVQERFEEVLK